VAYSLAAVGVDTAGGAEQVLSRIDAATMRAGARSIVVACEGSQVSGALIETPLASGRLDDAARRRAQAASRNAVQQALARYPVDIVHMHGLDFLECLPPPGVPVLATLHLPPEWYAPSIFAIARPDTYLNCVSASQETACPPAARPIPIVRNGVDVDTLAASGHARRAFALVLGRICPEKGTHLAIEAAATAGVPLVVAGEVFGYPEHRAYFEEEIAPHLRGGCRYAGSVGLARKRRLLSGARCLLVPSRAEETSSLVTMEALACGTPVIAFARGALPEIIDNGRTGYLVRDALEMGAAIRWTGRIDPATCRAEARRRFSAERMIADYHVLYAEIARQCPAREPRWT
jgi:glycosyltransferase involved in cell wall biosynthesis